MQRRLCGALCAMALFATVCLGLVTAQTPATVSATAPNEARFIPDKAMFGLVVRPNAILKNPELNKLYELASAMPGGLPEKELGTPLTNLDLLVVGGTLADPTNPGVMIPSVLLRTKDAAAMKTVSGNAIRPEFAKKTLPETTYEAFVAPKPRLQYLEKDDGKSFGPRPITTEEGKRRDAVEAEAAKDPNAWKISDAFVFPDDRTMTFSQQAQTLVASLNQLKPGAPAPTWAAKYEPATKFALSGFLDLKQTREMIKAVTAGRPPQGPQAMIFGMLSPLWEKADMAVIALDTTDGLKLTIVGHCPDEDSAKGLKGALDALLAMGKGFVPELKKQAGQLDALQPGLGAKLAADLDEAVTGLTVTQTGPTTIVKFAIKQSTLTTAVAAIGPAIQAAQAAAKQNLGINNLKMMALAMHNHHDTWKSFPASARMKKDGNPPHSWRVAILPFVEEDVLYKQYKFDEPWDSENNKKVAAQMPAIYRSPHADPKSMNTSYVVPIIDKGMFKTEASVKGPSINSITDGTSQTIMIIETETQIPWTKPEDLTIDATKPLPALGFADSPTLNVAFADGSARRIAKNVTLDVLLPFLTSNAGDVGDQDKLQPPVGNGPPAVRPAQPATRKQVVPTPAGP